MKLNVRLTALFLCAAMAFSLYGCRYSSVLEQIIYEMTKSNDIEDQYFYPEQNVMDSDNNTEDLVPIDVDETDRTHDEVVNLPTDEEENSDRGTQLSYDENAYSNQSTSQSSSDSTQSGTNSSGTNTATDTTKGTGNSSRGDTTTSDGIANNSETGEGSDSVQKSDIGGSRSGGGDIEGINIEPTSNASPTDPYLSGSDDSDGSSSDDNNSGKQQNTIQAGTVAATGSVALMVMMLTGDESNLESALVATNSDLKYDGNANKVFPCLSNTDEAWKGDETGYVDIEVVKESQADLVAYVGTSEFNTSQQYYDIKNMYEEIDTENNGEDHILVLDDMSESQDNVENNMMKLANALSDHYPEAVSRANYYIEQWSADVQKFANTNTEVGTYTLYIDGWDANVQYTMTADNKLQYEGRNGCAYISDKGTTLGKSVITYMNIGRVTDVISLANASKGLPLYYVPLSANKAESGTWTPYYQTFQYFYNTYSIGQMLTEAGESTWNRLYGGSPGLGNEGFKTIVAGNVETLQGIRGDSYASDYGAWAVYGTVTGNSSFSFTQGFLNEDGEMIDSYIYGDYEIVVNPCGLISDWVTAGPESILESAWAAYKLRGVGDYSIMAGYVESFYKDLCRYDIQPWEIEGILMDDEYYFVTGS